MKKIYQTIAIFGLLCVAFPKNANAQTKVYANTISASTSSYVDNASQSIDGNLSTRATIRANSGIAGGIGAYTGYLEIQFASTLPANTTSYVKVDAQDDILNYLLGGNLGGVLSTIGGGVLTGNQSFTVQAKNGSTVVLSGSSTTPSSFAGSELRVVQNNIGEYFLMVTPPNAYNRIRITNSAAALVGLNVIKRFYVYDAFYITGSSACNIGNYTSYNSTGIDVDLLNLGGTGVTNAYYAIDSNTTNYSELGTGILGVASSVSQTVYFDGASSASDEYRVQLAVPPALLDLGVADNVTISAYNGSTLQAQYNLSTLLDLDLIGLLADGEPVSVGFTPGVTDRITITLSTLVSVEVAQSLQIYGVVRGSFDVNVSGGGSYAINDSATLITSVSGCNSPYTYLWSDAGGSTTSSISIDTSAPGTYSYDVKVTDLYGISQTVTTEVVIEAEPVGGTIAGEEQFICPGTTPNDLELEDYTGSVVRWEKANNSNFAGAETINNTSAILTGGEIGAISETTYFRAVVGNYTYPEVYSDTVVVNIKTTTWDGTQWTNGSPDITTVIYFTGNYNESVSIEGCSIEVSNNAVVTIPSGYNATIYGAIRVVSGSFTLEDNANLLQLTGDAANSGDITVKKNSSPLYRLDYTMWCSPVTGQNLYDYSPATDSNRFYIYNTSSDLFSPIDPVANDFTVGSGYLIRMPNFLPDSGTTAGYNAGTTSYIYPGEFIGEPNNGDITATVSTTGNGYNLVGNPYPSPINIHDFFDGNTGTIEATSALYFWRKRNDPNASSYCTITKLAYTSNSAAGGDTSSHIYVGDPSTWVINSGQGFIMQAQSSSLNFTNSMRRAINNGQFFRPAQNENPMKSISRYWVSLNTSENLVSQTVIGHTDITTNELDYGWDGKLLQQDFATLYTMSAGEKLTIQARAPFDVTDNVVMGFTVSAAGTYALNLEKFDGVFNSKQAIYIIDSYTQTIHNLKEGDYNFSSEAGTFDDRFIITYEVEALNNPNIQTPDSNAVAVYKNNSGITVNSGNINITDITVHDTRGRLLYKTGNVYSPEVDITNLQAAQQVLLVTVNTEKSTVTKKIAY